MMRRARPLLGTLVEITVSGAAVHAAAQAVGRAAGCQAADQVLVHAAIDAAFARIAMVQSLMSFHNPASEVSRLNRAVPGSVLALSSHTMDVLHLAQRMAALSDGIFNIACAPRLVDWGRLPSPPAPLPTYAPGQAVFECLDEAQVRKLAPGWIDLGGIAKGYAVDQACAALAGAGIASACVNAGGDLRVLGNMPFPVLIRAPRNPHRAAARLELADGALATSSIYFSAAVHAGQAVSALVDGRSGTPITSARSASVQASSCVVADALTKIVLASDDAQHPALAACGASAILV